MPSLPIIENQGASGFGISFWSSFYRCPRRSWLYKQMTRAREDLPVSPPPDEEAEDEAPLIPMGAREFLESTTGRIHAAKRGVLVHKLLELRHTVGLADVGEISYPDPTNTEWVDACRAVSAYCEKYPLGEFADVMSEIPFQFGRPADIGQPPETWDPRAARFGVPVISGRIDMSGTILPEAVAGIRQTRGIPIFKPGRYLMDYKTMRALASSWQLEMLNSFQFNLYAQAWELLMGEQPHGTIASALMFYKNRSDIVSKGLPNAFVPYPNPAQQQVLKSYLAGAYERLLRYGESAPNPEMCFIYKGAPCEHFTSGACNRT